MNVFDFILTAIAVWRISYMVVFEDGPGDIFLMVRATSGTHILGEDGRPDSGMGRILSCLFCTSMWVSFLLMFCPMFIIVPFALSGAAIIVQKVVELCSNP